jgi:hypothetical protein
MQPPSIALDPIEPLTSRVAAFRAGDCALNGLDLYYELERATPLLDFHTILRLGPKNLGSDGLQQSYGDHNRLLMLGLDRMVDADLDWYCSRLDGAGDVDATDLAACFDAVGTLGLGRDELVALWLAGALHDCGMLCGRGAYVDVEDGVVLSHDVIEELCPDALRDLAYFVLHNHDYIKDVFLGEMPAAPVRRELEALDPELQPTALAALGIVQVAGAASLGPGRLGRFRVEIFRRCVDGTALDDCSRATRIERLLSPEPEQLVAHASPATDDDALAPFPADRRDALARFLDAVPVHGWQRAHEGEPSGERRPALLALASQWEATGADRIVVARDADAGTHVETALSGCRLLITT